MNPPRRVRAARLKEHGKPLAVKDVELREPREDEVLVELQYGGVNPFDRYVAEGQVAADRLLPRTLGGEASGTLDGRRVLVSGEGLGAMRDGVWTEAAVVPSHAVVDLPDGVELRDAAVMGFAGLTAWEVVHEVGRVAAEDRVVVLGAAGGVGTMIVSVAHAAGATVWGQSSSPEKIAAVEEQGADKAFVAGPDELLRVILDFEPTLVLDALGDGFVAPVLDALAVHGRMVSFGTSAGPDVQFNMQTLYHKGLSILGHAGGQLGREKRRSGLQGALEALRDGSLKVRIDDVLPLEDVNEGMERLARHEVVGKLLLDLQR
ncbi:MAG TPA: zinc-binding alcohol dehydrogenase family protein [Solirubrobacteraceae bacterium]|nr:zinc-binding alcohol dehydrogenase family protein [Solirubrobacteraceae bacterium]